MKITNRLQGDQPDSAMCYDNKIHNSQREQTTGLLQIQFHFFF